MRREGRGSGNRQAAISDSVNAGLSPRKQDRARICNSWPNSLARSPGRHHLKERLQLRSNQIPQIGKGGVVVLDELDK